jgi:hypothetical protein
MVNSPMDRMVTIPVRLHREVTAQLRVYVIRA